MYMKRNILRDGLTLLTEGNNSLPIQIRFFQERKEKTSYSGSFGDGALPFLIEFPLKERTIPEGSTDKIDFIYNFVRTKINPVISKEEMITLFDIIKINDLGAQSMSPGFADVFLEIFYNGYKILSRDYFILRDYLTKEMYVAFNKDLIKIKSNEENSDIVIIINYRQNLVNQSNKTYIKLDKNDSNDSASIELYAENTKDKREFSFGVDDFEVYVKKDEDNNYFKLNKSVLHLDISSEWNIPEMKEEELTQSAVLVSRQSYVDSTNNIVDPFRFLYICDIEKNSESAATITKDKLYKIIKISDLPLVGSAYTYYIKSKDIHYKSLYTTTMGLPYENIFQFKVYDNTGKKLIPGSDYNYSPSTGNISNISSKFTSPFEIVTISGANRLVEAAVTIKKNSQIDLERYLYEKKIFAYKDMIANGEIEIYDDNGKLCYLEDTYYKEGSESKTLQKTDSNMKYNFIIKDTTDFSDKNTKFQDGYLETSYTGDSPFDGPDSITLTGVSTYNKNFNILQDSSLIITENEEVIKDGNFYIFNEDILEGRMPYEENEIKIEKNKEHKYILNNSAISSNYSKQELDELKTRYEEIRSIEYNTFQKAINTNISQVKENLLYALNESNTKINSKDYTGKISLPHGKEFIAILLESTNDNKFDIEYYNSSNIPFKVEYGCVGKKNNENVFQYIILPFFSSSELVKEIKIMNAPSGTTFKYYIVR